MINVRKFIMTCLLASYLATQAMAADIITDYRGSAIVVTEDFSGIGSVKSENPDGTAKLWRITINTSRKLEPSVAVSYAFTKAISTVRGSILLTIFDVGTIELMPSDQHIRDRFMAGVVGQPRDWRVNQVAISTTEAGVITIEIARISQ